MQAVFDLPGAVTEAVSEAWLRAVWGRDPRPRPELAPTPRDTIFRDGTAQVYRFRPVPTAPAAPRRPLLLVPSLINRWYVLDLRRGASLVEALVGAGIDTYCLDWGVARDEDRHLTWEDVLARLDRATRVVRRATGAPRVGILGYCMGATLSAIHTALHPDRVAALVNLAGPIDFAHAGFLGTMVNARWFDPSAVAAAGNVHPLQMQAGFATLRPTLDLAKRVGFVDRAASAAARESFQAIEAWSGDNIPFPAAAYEVYIREIYQQNQLVLGRHHVGGRRVNLGAIRCPLLAIGSERDTICPLPAARALLERSGSSDTELLTVDGGHVGAVVGAKAARRLYPATAAWLRDRLDRVEPAAEAM